MKVEVLLSTMNQEDYSILDKMNVQSDILVINQSKNFDVSKFKYKEKDVVFLSLNEKGIGLSRNTALMRSKADLCVLADDDIVYEDHYEQLIVEEFRNNPSADVIIFSVEIIDNNGSQNKILKRKRVRFYNALSYGAVRIVFRREKVVNNNIFFSLLFGGGASYGSGEDSAFIMDCLRKGLKIYTSPIKIATVHNHSSSWFQGYNSRYFFDKGALFRFIFGYWYGLMCLQFSIRHRCKYRYEIGFFESFRLMLAGGKAISRTL